MRAVRRVRFYLGRRLAAQDTRRPFARTLRPRGRPPFVIRARVRVRDGSVWTLDGTLNRRCTPRSAVLGVSAARGGRRNDDGTFPVLRATAQREEAIGTSFTQTPNLGRARVVVTR